MLNAYLKCEVLFLRQHLIVLRETHTPCFLIFVKQHFLTKTAAHFHVTKSCRQLAFWESLLWALRDLFHGSQADEVVAHTRITEIRRRVATGERRVSCRWPRIRTHVCCNQMDWKTKPKLKWFFFFGRDFLLLFSEVQNLVFCETLIGANFYTIKN